MTEPILQKYQWFGTETRLPVRNQFLRLHHLRQKYTGGTNLATDSKTVWSNLDSRS